MMELLVTASVGLFQCQGRYYLQTIVADSESNYLAEISKELAERISDSDDLEITANDGLEVQECERSPKNPIPTNDQLFKALFDDLTPIQKAMFRERCLKIAKITKEAANGRMDEFADPIIAASGWIKLAETIVRHLGYEG